MNSSNMLLAAPELWVLVMACVILIVDLFLSEERRGIIQLLALGTLVFAAIITLRADYLSEGLRSVTAFMCAFEATLRMRTFSLIPGIPGIMRQVSLTIRSILTPACAAL